MKIGSLFSGYGGLDMAVANVTGAETVWVSDIDKGACKILAHRYPDIPNLGDISTVDWASVEPVDILTGGFPCQDVSHAGKRAGIRPGTRSGLWSQMAYAIDQLRPRMVVIENVRGLLSAHAHSDMEPCPWCVGDGSGQSALRALGAVLGDLADLGYDAQWHGLRAADVGAPHGRFRVFVIATPRDASARGWNDPRSPQGRGGSSKPAGGSDSEAVALLPTPTRRDHKDHMIRREPHRPDDTDTLSRALAGPLLPTPAVNDMGAGKTVDAWDAWTDDMRSKHGNGNGHGKSLHVEAARLLPTPKATNNENRQSLDQYGMNLGQALGVTPLLPTPLVGSTSPAAHGQISGDYRKKMDEALADFGQYAPAIARWEHTLGRPAPAPTEPTGQNGAHRLSPAFVEWMMGLPAGWVTDVPGITRNEALKACGNGVVPQQAEAALRHMLGQLALAA